MADEPSSSVCTAITTDAVFERGYRSQQAKARGSKRSSSSFADDERPNKKASLPADLARSTSDAFSGQSVLLIHASWAAKIFAGDKTYEIRGRPVDNKVNTRILIAISGAGVAQGDRRINYAIGSVEISGCHEVTSEEQWKAERVFHCVNSGFDDLPYATAWAWHLSSPKLFTTPVPFETRSGQVVFAIFRPVTEQ